MRGAWDGGAHIEGMRTEHMKSGNCQLHAEGCEGFSRRLEFHHESYAPERGLHVCHHCHHVLHFRPYDLTREQKVKLLSMRHEPARFAMILERQELVEAMIREYVAPGRRPAQLAVRRRVKREVRERAHRML
jgi:hypothetical protein